MGDLMFGGGIIVFCLIVLFTIVFLFSRVYKRSTKNYAFVRTGSGGAKVIKDGGALVLPILHDVIQVNMNTMKLEVSKKQKEALITFDRMRVDVSAEFYVRVKQDEKAIENAAQTLGSKTLEPDELKKLVEGKFVDALRSVASSMTMNDLHEKRANFVQAVQQAVESDLEKNGLELESVSLTSFDQTDRDFFNPDNAFDAQGLTRLTEEIEQRTKTRNDIIQENKIKIAQKNLDTEREELLIRQNAETARFEANKQIALQKSAQDSEIARFEAEKTREAEIAVVEAQKIAEQARINKDKELRMAKLEAELDLEQKTVEKERVVKEAMIAQQRQLELAEQDKQIALAKKSEEEAAARASSEEARGKQVQATEDVTTISQLAEADRAQKIELIKAEALARKDSIQIVISAEAERKAAEERSHSILTIANADAKAEEVRAKGVEARYAAEAEGQRKLNEAANIQSADIIRMNIQQKLIEALPAIIRESVKPMEHIDSIRIVDMGNAHTVGNSGVAALENGSGSNGSLPDQVVNASLRHRAAAPLMDSLLESLGINQGANISQMVQEVCAKNDLIPTPEVTVENALKAKPVAINIGEKEVKKGSEDKRQLDLDF